MQLTELYDDAIHCILRYLDLEGLLNFSATNRRFYQLTKSEITSKTQLKLEMTEVDFNSLFKIGRKYQSCNINFEGSAMKTNRRNWNAFLKDHLASMDLVILRSSNPLKFEEINRTLVALRNLTHLELVQIKLEKFVIPQFVPVFKQLKTLELSYCHNVSSKFFTKSSQLKCLKLIANTVDAGLFNINEILLWLTCLEELTIFEHNSTAATNFLETDISDQIQFKLKTFVHIKFAALQHQPNLIRFLETQDELKCIGFHLPSLYEEYSFLDDKAFMKVCLDSYLADIEKSFKDHEGTHLFFRAERRTGSDRLAFFTALKRIFSNIENLTLDMYFAQFSPAQSINGFTNVKMLNYSEKDGNLATLLGDLRLGGSLTELRLLGHSVSLADWTSFIHRNPQLKTIHLKIAEPNTDADKQEFNEATWKLPHLEEFEMDTVETRPSLRLVGRLYVGMFLIHPMNF
jgi:hypothetical protein